MNNNEKHISSGRSDDDLDNLVGSTPIAKQAEERVFVPKLAIRQKIKGESLRPLGARIPTAMIEDLKELASYHDANLDDLVAGVLGSVLEESMDAIYENRIKEYKERRKNRKY